MRLRTYLPLLTVGVYLPILAAIGGVLVVSAKRQQAATEQQLFVTARAVAAAADRALEDSIDSLQAIGSAFEFLDGNVPRAYALVRHAVESQPDWLSVSLLDVTGKRIFVSNQPLGAPLPSPIDRENVRRAIATGLPAITPELVIGRLSHAPVVGVAVPVYVAGKMNYILVADYAYPGLQRIFRAIELPAGSTAAILDRRGITIVTNGADPTLVGRPARTATVIEAARAGVERATHGMNRYGEATFAAVAPTQLARWSVVIGMSIDAYERPLWDTLWTIGGGGSVLVLLSALAAALGGRRIAFGVADLARSAEALGGRDPMLRPTATGLDEIRDVAMSLQRAGRTIQQREQERDEALYRLESRIRYQEVIALIGQLGLRENTVDQLLGSATRAIAAALGVEFCAVMELDPDRRTLLLRAGHGWPPTLIGQARVDNDPRSQPGHALVVEAPAVIENAAEERRIELPSLMREQGIVSGLAVVLQKGNGPFGILGAHSRTPRRFSIDEIHFCATVAALLSTIFVRWENEQAVRRLATENAELAAAIDAADCGVVFTDPARPGYPILFVNPAFTRITGYTAEEVGGRDCEFLRGPDTDLRDVAVLDDAMAARRVVTVTLRCYRKDGTPFWNELTVSPVPASGEPRLFIGIMTDVTDRRAAEDQLRQAQKMEAIGQLTGGVAHDFNNLLTVILGNAEMIGDRTPADTEIGQMATLAMNAAERGRALTKRLLSFARVQPLEPELIEVNPLVSGLEDMLQRTLDVRIRVELDLDPSGPAILADRLQLETAILNLAINSRDAMPEGGTLTLRTTTATGATGSADGSSPGAEGFVVIEVVDSGVGMPPDVLARACEPFFTTKEIGQGSGLGLSSVYGFAQQSGGRLEIRSKPGAGTTVALLFPRVFAPRSAIFMPRPRTPVSPGQDDPRAVSPRRRPAFPA